MVQWIRPCLPTQEVPIQSLVRQVRSHMPCGQKPKHENSNNIITNSIKTLKMVYVKKKKKTGLRWIDDEQVIEEIRAHSGGDTRASWLEGWEVS